MLGHFGLDLGLLYITGTTVHVFDCMELPIYNRRALCKKEFSVKILVLSETPVFALFIWWFAFQSMCISNNNIFMKILSTCNLFM